MDYTLAAHNTHRENPEEFTERDPNLSALRDRNLVHRFALLDHLPREEPGIYSICGGRQIGKTTLLKSWMAELLKGGIGAERISYYTGELIDDHHALVRILTEELDGSDDQSLRYILLDEVTCIKDWDKGIKFLADAGSLRNVALVITGSDLTIIQEARMRFPGRRGRADVVDFKLRPLSFADCVALKGRFSANELLHLREGDAGESETLIDRLFTEFDEYLIHGGFLTAINDMSENERIAPATFAVYSDWIRGDVLKRGLRENYLRETLGAIEKRLGSQITWNSLAKDLSIDHPKTVSDYAALLVSMDVVFIQPALREDKLTAAPKKARKLMFMDPFIFHAVRAWLNPCKDPFREQVAAVDKDPQMLSNLVEACAATLIGRIYPTYYIKAEGEVDIAYVKDGAFYPIEVKWRTQIRPKDLKQVSKYPQAQIWDRSHSRGEINGVRNEPLPLALMQFSE